MTGRTTPLSSGAKENYDIGMDVASVSVAGGGSVVYAATGVTRVVLSGFGTLEGDPWTLYVGPSGHGTWVRLAERHTRRSFTQVSLLHDP